MKKLLGMVFDFNGVLWMDTELQEKAWKEYSAKIRGNPLTDDEMAVHVHGRNNRYTFGYLVGHEVSEADLENYTQGKESAYRELCLKMGDDFKLSPGAIELLEFLKSNNIPHTIATASEKGNLDFFVKHLDLSRWFDISKIVYDNGTLPGKPAPDIYLKACANINLSPDNCLVVEDAVSGIKAAKTAGIGIIAALGSKYSDVNLKSELGYDLAITSLKDLDFEKLFK